MKLNKTITALALAMGVASVSQAQSVYITGSTAFRSQIYQALVDLHVVSVQPLNSNTRTYQGTVKALNDFTGAANLSAGNTVTALCSFNGSGAGVGVVSTALASPTYVTAATGAATTCAWGADVTFSDVDQLSTIFPAAGLNEISSTDGALCGYGSGCAVVCWCWAASTDCNKTITDITPLEMTDLFNAGSEAYSVMEGVPGAAGIVYATGRNNDSGTRITAELLAGWDPSVGITVWTINGDESTTFPAGQTFKIDTALDPALLFNGYTSGGNVASALNLAGAGKAVSYLGFSDAANLTGQAIPINFWGVNPLANVAVTAFVPNNAVSGAWNFGAIEAGQYPFWAYEHCYNSAHDAAASWVVATFMPDLINELQYEILHPAAGTVRAADVISNLKVHRTQDGGPILAGN
jgi:hypothetical protein